jgi:protein TonB
MIRNKFIAFVFFLVSIASFGQTKSDSVSEKFYLVEQSAEYPGGMPKFYQYINKNLKYPRGARKAGVNGRVYIEFIVNKDGAIDDESVRAVPAHEVSEFIKSGSNIISDNECELEAIRLIKECPNWSPGLQMDKPVRQRMVVPIIFKL